MKRYRAVCDCGRLDHTYSTRGHADRAIADHSCRTHRRSCRTCGWTHTASTAKLADRSKRQHSCARQIAKAAARERGAARLAAIDRSPKPCVHKRADHQHGTNACYVLDKCRCHPCSRARARQDNTRNRLQAYGRYDRYLPADEARAHVAALAARGMGLKRIVAVSDVSHGALWKLMYGKTRPDGSRTPSRRITRTLHDRILAVQLDLAAGAKIPALGTHRRIQALVALGWSQSKIATRIGVNRSNFGTMMARPAVQRRTHDAMVALYDEWSMLLPPATNQRERISVSRARSYGKARGWAPPLAWDDDNLDNPDAVPHRPSHDTTSFRDADLDEAAILRRLAGDRTVRLNIAEKEELFRRSRAAGMSDKQTAQFSGYTKPERYTPRQENQPA